MEMTSPPRCWVSTEDPSLTSSSTPQPPTSPSSSSLILQPMSTDTETALWCISLVSHGARWVKLLNFFLHRNEKWKMFLFYFYFGRDTKMNCPTNSFNPECNSSPFLQRCLVMTPVLSFQKSPTAGRAHPTLSWFRAPWWPISVTLDIRWSVLSCSCASGTSPGAVTYRAVSEVRAQVLTSPLMCISDAHWAFLSSQPAVGHS